MEYVLSAKVRLSYCLDYVEILLKNVFILIVGTGICAFVADLLSDYPVELLRVLMIFK